MKAVGFKNFRNFEEFPMMPIEGVTFLVGQNNSGKSTFTKACRILSENMEKWFVEGDSNYGVAPNECGGVFNFDTVCKTVERAKKIGSTSNMEFAVKTGDFEIIYSFGNFAPNNFLCHLSCVRIYDSQNDCSWVCDFEKQETFLEYNGVLLANIMRNDEEYRRLSLFKSPKALERLSKDKQEIANCRIAVAESKIEEADKHKEKHVYKLGRMHTPFNILNQEGIVLRGLDLPVSSYSFDEYNEDEKLWSLEKWDDLLKNLTEPASMKKNTIDATWYFHCLRERYLKAIRPKLLYIPSHETPMQSTFIVDNVSDRIGFLFAEYLKLDVYLRRWVEKQMEYLGIGKRLVITVSDSGETFSVKVKDLKDQEVFLSDMGRGPVQLILLLVQIVCFNAPYWESYLCDVKSPNQMLIIEEPEQNLHPALQSKLAEVFFDAHKYLGCRVLVETHSEYMIRRSQVLTAQMCKEHPDCKIPFHTYYFPQDSAPYDMEYQPNGKFKRKFKPGFYDVADDLIIDLI